MADDELSRLRDTDNGPKDEDGPQDGVPQDPDTTVVGDAAPEAGEAASGGLLSRLFGKKVQTKDVLKVCRSQLGEGEHPPGSNHNKYTNWYGMDGPWCDMFQGWCDEQAAGSGWLKKAGRYAYTPYHAQFFHKKGRWGHKPRVGALVFYDWSGGDAISGIDHIERVEAVNADGTFYAIGGNVSDKVKRTRRSMKFVVGFGYPPYNTTVEDPGPDAWPGRYLKLTTPNQHGSDVTFVQKKLNEKADAGLDVDGVYGEKTAAAVKAYQKAHDLEVDGVVGPKTWKSLAG